jgi:hypothetical protein
VESESYIKMCKIKAGTKKTKKGRIKAGSVLIFIANVKLIL